MRILISILCLVAATGLSAQSILPDYPHLNTGCQGQSYPTTNLTLDPNPGGVLSWTWKITKPPSATIINPDASGSNTLRNCTALGINLANSSTNTSTISGTIINNAIVNGVYTVEIKVGTATRTYSLAINNGAGCPNCPVNRDFAFVLDQSGSMDDPPGANSKWEILKRNLSDNLPVMKGIAGLGANDRLGFFLFEDRNVVEITTDASAAAYSLDFSDISDAASVDALVFAGRVPGGGTPIGGALNQAIRYLNNRSSAQKTLVLFTDGMQNVNPMVTGADYNMIEITPTDWPAGGISCCNAGLPLNINSLGNKFRLFTIGVGADPGLLPMLEALSKPDGVYQQSNTGTSTEVAQFFSAVIPYSLRDCSPRILDIQQGRLTQSAPKQIKKFKVNRFVDHFTLTVAGAPRVIGGLKTQLIKDGQVLDISPTMLSDGQIVYALNFPYQYAGQSLSESGEWAVEISSKQGMSSEIYIGGDLAPNYTVTAYVNDETLRHEMMLGDTTPGSSRRKPIFTGDAIKVHECITFLGEPLIDAEVEALLLKPGEDLGDLAAAFSVDTTGFAINNEPGTPIGLAKINALMQNPAFVAKLKQTQRIKTLDNEGNGNYTTSFSNTTESGTYQIVLHINGTNPGAGTYQGYETQGVLVDFSAPKDVDLFASSPKQLNPGPPPTYTFTLTPTNQFGNKLGPGQTNRIKVVNTATGVNGQVVDRLDGSYQITIPAINIEQEVQVFAGNQSAPVYIGPLNKLPRQGRHPFGISLHVGATIPTGTLANTYNPGVAIEGDLTYRLTDSWAIEAIGGYYGFQPQYYILGGTLGALYSRPVGSNLFHVAAGIGGFLPENGDITYGYSVRTGLGRQFTRHVYGGLELGYLGLPDNDTNFGKISVGLKYFW